MTAGHEQQVIFEGCETMAKLRVYELAKEKGISSKDLLDILKDLGVEAKSHVSTIDENVARTVLEILETQKASGTAAPSRAAVAEPVPAEAKVEKIEVPGPIEAKPAAAQKAPPPASAKPHPAPGVDPAVQDRRRLLQLALPITVSDMARKMGMRATDVIKKMLEKGAVFTINQSLKNDEALKVATAFGFELEAQTVTDEPEWVEEDDPRMMVTRPPVVTILGHVDHGKTSLLDAIRKTNVTAKEAGGITQRIGAYMVEHNGRKIVFLDTPGHEAFTAMRARGAQVTDIAVMVIAADDGIMPQTIEAIDHARAAKVPIIVAINKIDKPGANPDRVKQQLSDLGLQPEDWGGDTITIPVSAREKTGLEDLLEMILLVADMNELKANPRRTAMGIIIEAKLDKGLGPVATVLVKKGTLRVGDSVIAGVASGKVRLLINDRGERIKKATPSIPAEIIGLSEVARAGDTLQVVRDEKLARQITSDRQDKSRAENLVSGPKASLDDIFRQMQEGAKKELNIIIKADGQGSVEALKHSLSRISNEEVEVRIIHGGAGSITESDILLANASNAVIIGFNIRLDPNIKKLGESEKIDIRQYNVIYHVLEDIKAAITGMLKPIYEEVLIGRVEVRTVFKISKVGVIAGSYVLSGKVLRGADARVVRGTETVYEGKIDSLKRFKDDVKEVTEGFECGVGVEKFTDIQAGDIIEVYQTQEKPR